jgi:hypothetical protein
MFWETNVKVIFIIFFSCLTARADSSVVELVDFVADLSHPEQRLLILHSPQFGPVQFYCGTHKSGATDLRVFTTGSIKNGGGALAIVAMDSMGECNRRLNALLNLLVSGKVSVVLDGLNNEGRFTEIRQFR